MGRLSALLLLVLTAAAALRGQGMPSQMPAGQGLILGRVVEGSSDRGVGGAMVTLLPSGRNAANPISVLTAPDGGFVFRSLPAGTFGLRVSMTGWLSGRVLSLQLGEGEKINDAVLTLTRTAAISGQVVDDVGEGIEGIQLTIFTLSSGNGRRTISTAYETVTTDDRGVYRFGSLSPAQYIVCALFSRHSTTLVGGSGSGYRSGDFALISGSGSRNVDPAPDESGRQSVFADACYGGTTPANAQPVTLESGQERAQVNLALRLVPGVRLIGTLIGPANRVAGQTVHLVLPQADDVAYSGPEVAYTNVDSAGRFGFVGVPVGTYVLMADISASGSVQEVRNSQGMLVSRTENGLVNPQPALWAMAPIMVGETDITDVALTLREAVRLSGQLLFDGNTARPTPAQLMAAQVSVGSGAQTGPTLIGALTSEGTFTIAGLKPGRYVASVRSVPSGWFVRSILADGKDFSDDPLEVTGGDVSGVVITLTDRPSHVTGVVHDATGAPDPRAAVIIFPADRARWGRVGSRSVGTPFVSRQGEFDYANLRDGEYFVVAVSDRQRPDLSEEQFAALARVANRVTVREGDRVTVSLTTRAVR